MLGLPGIYSFQRSLLATPNELVFELDADVRGKFLGGFMLNPRNPLGVPSNPRHSHKTQVLVGGLVVFESYHQSRAVWDIAQWKWDYLVGLMTYRLQSNASPSIPSGGRSYTNVLPDYWGTYFPPQTVADKNAGTFETTLQSNVPASTTPRDPTYVYDAPHLPVWFVFDRQAGQQIKITVQASMEVPAIGGQLNDDYPVAETNQTFSGQIVAWLIRL